MKKYNTLTLAVCSVIFLQSHLLCSCTNDELVNEESPTSDAVIFNTSMANMTRADGNKLQDTHYEFGVYGYWKNSDFEPLMNNYLVGWGGSWNGGNSPYKAYNGEAQTYGDPDSQVTGLSYWFYQGLGSADDKHPTCNTPDEAKQVLKFWDKSKPEAYFFAYTPYNNKVNNTVEHEINWKDGDVWHTKFIGLKAFYEKPVTQINSITETGKELFNKYEALHAVKKVVKANYGEDVDLQFKHVNAKINIAFYNDVNGYDVSLIDLVPTDGLAGPNSTLINAVSGIQLSPATAAQAATPMTVVQPAEEALPVYTTQSTVTATYSNVTTGSPTATFASTVNTQSKNNLEFQLTSSVLPVTGGANALSSPTSLFVLPNAKSDGTYIENTPATTTGFTIHVSYTLTPKDGGRALTIYDARAYVPASCCKWEAGKAYTYIFKITSASSGIQVSTTGDPATPAEPWIDKRDPRVPGGQMKPIVFDALQVSNYDGSNSEYIIQETTGKIPADLAEVNLGIGVTFANMNLEANDYYYFSWGNVAGHPMDYPFGDYYETSPAYYITDTNIQGTVYDPGKFNNIYESCGDAATYRWGGDWKLPTSDDFTNLYNASEGGSPTLTKEWTTIEGIEGIKFTMISDDAKVLFLPATGYSANGINTNPKEGYYWTADKKIFHFKHENTGTEAAPVWVISQETIIPSESTIPLSCGLCIRPIKVTATP
ncbi:MAG: hypothetical protein Q4F34_01450 [Prevotellaceae bacterium]|nr:hypothetical protein [Prevotellaceae bacterium]